MKLKSNTSYKALLNDTRWHLKRKEILTRDSYRCRNCNETSGLQVHHRQYHINNYTGEFINPWNYSAKYLVTLCEKCHANGHEKFRVPVFRLTKK